MMMRAARKVYVLADHSKFERSTPVRIAPVPQIEGLIVDRAPPESIVGAAAAKHWPIILAGG
jgi:DeoR/GlpR family transcriptional regulator of sugar metabolism